MYAVCTHSVNKCVIFLIKGKNASSTILSTVKGDTSFRKFLHLSWKLPFFMFTDYFCLSFYSGFSTVAGHRFHS